MNNRRFNLFARNLSAVTGDKAVLLSDGKVQIEANEFSCKRTFCDLQEAIDHFAYLLRLK